jgi:hypothetical protein
MKPLRNKTILVFTLVAYLFIVFSNEKWDLPMFEVLPISILGVYDFFTLALPLSGFLGVAIMMINIFSNHERSVYKNKLLFAGLILLLIPLIIIQSSDNSVAIEADRGLYLFLPEIFFLAGFVMIMRKIFIKGANEKGDKLG